jgi:hypothetical protein
MSKRKFGIDSDDCVGVPLSSITGDQVAVLQHVQDALPVDLNASFGMGQEFAWSCYQDVGNAARL